MRKQQRQQRNPKIGYHHTSWECWKQIQKAGAILPYRHMRHEQELVDSGFKPPVLGVWIWTEPMDLASEYANVFWHVCTKRTKRVVILQVEWYESERLLTGDGRNYVSLYHRITWDNVVEFHENSIATILGSPIPLAGIKLLREYDFSDHVRIVHDFNRSYGVQAPLLPGKETEHLPEVFQASHSRLEMRQVQG